MLIGFIREDCHCVVYDVSEDVLHDRTSLITHIFSIIDAYHYYCISLLCITNNSYLAFFGINFCSDAAGVNAIPPLWLAGAVSANAI